MQINYEKEKTFSLDEKTISELIRYIFSGNFIVDREIHIANKVKLLPAIHFYRETKNNEKDVYKFKKNKYYIYDGKFILSKVKKSNVQESEKFFNIEIIEKTEHFDEDPAWLNCIHSIIHKERMVIDFRQSKFKFCFDRVVAVDPIKMTKNGKNYYFLEIEYENPDLSFRDIIEKFNLNYLKEPKYFIGILNKKISLSEVIKTKKVTEYLNMINENCYSSFFEQFSTKYYFNNKNIELELKIKNPEKCIKEKLLEELSKKFSIIHYGKYLVEDDYYDYNKLLLINNLSYRIRKSKHNQNWNVFFKVPLENKGIFSSRIEYMSKFRNYDECEIINSNCYVNKIMNKYFNYDISSKLEKIIEAKTFRDAFLLFNQGDNKFLVGSIVFDESNFIKNKDSIKLQEIEFEISNDSINQSNFFDNYSFINNIFYKYPIENTNKYLNAIKQFFNDEN